MSALWLLHARCAVLPLWRFFPQFRDFRATLGSSSLLRNFSFIPRLHSWCCPFCSACLFSSSLSLPVASLVCFSCWPPSLFVRLWLWGSCLVLLHVCASRLSIFSSASRQGGYQICVSSLRFGSGLYVEAGFLGGKHLGVCGSGSCCCTLLVVPISVCGVFSVAAELCILSSCWGWGRLLLCLFWCDCSAFYWGTCGFPLRVMQLATLLGFHT